MRLHASEAQCAEGEDRLINGHVGRHVCSSAQALGTGMGLASTWLAEQRASGSRETHNGMGSYKWGDSQYSASTSTTRRSGLNAISRYWRRPAERSADAQGYGSWRAISTWSLRPLGNVPHPRDCQESSSDQRYPRSDTEPRFDALTTLWCTMQWPARCWKCVCWKNQGSALTTQFR